MNKKQWVKDRYGKIARQGGSCCGPNAGQTCCGPVASVPADVATSSRADTCAAGIGYSQAELASLPEGANMGLGCGNPVALASLTKGETVLDLGCGAGVDCFLAANRVGPEGRVIGVDMTEEMIQRARWNAEAGGYENVEFRVGDIENLPVEDESVDVVLSNCVLNLVPDKDRAFAEIARVLKPGGRLCVSDIVRHGPLPDCLNTPEAYSACAAGALLKDDWLAKARAAGLTEITILDEVSADAILDCVDVEELGRQVGPVDLNALRGLLSSVTIEARKPAADGSAGTS